MCINIVPAKCLIKIYMYSIKMFDIRTYRRNNYICFKKTTGHLNFEKFKEKNMGFQSC